ncbi:MAG: hypothetical protein ACI9TH_003673 [Kiritimatiellia bacterium]|jgi:uncharacterized protein YccT (UPF0319 family)
MKKCFPLLLLVLVGCASTQIAQLYEGPARSADAIALLDVPYDFNLLAIDGRENRRVQLGVQSGPRQFAILPGDHTLRLSYYRIWDRGSDDHDVVRSQPFEVSFVAEAGRQYTLSFPPSADLAASLAYADAPVVEVTPLQAPVPEKKAATQRADPRALAPAGPPPTQSADLMKFWWEKATDAEKAEFKAWQESQKESAQK